jgi:protein SCO1
MTAMANTSFGSIDTAGSMRKLLFFVFSLMVTLIDTTIASAHSLADVEESLKDQEMYFQAVDYHAPGFSLQDADSKTVSLADLRGKIVILNFIYTSCPEVCPLHSEMIAQIQAMINQTPMKSLVQFVTITTDPKQDTGQALRDDGKANGLDPINWSFLTAARDQPEDTTRKIAEAYGLKFTRTEEGMQMHGIVTHVIDQDRRMRARFHGLKFEPVNLITFVNALTNRGQEPHGHPQPSLWEKLKGFF